MKDIVKNRLTGVELDGFFVYGCEDCGQGFPLFTEKGLEGRGDGAVHKPVPFSIQCPFCRGHNCRDVSFEKYPMAQAQGLNPKRQRVPYFANVEGDACGKPTDMEYAKPVYRWVAKTGPGDETIPVAERHTEDNHA